MPQRLLAIFGVLKDLGRVPKPLSVLAAIWGLLVLTAVVVVWVAHAWGGELGADLLVFTGMVLVVGLGALFSGRREE